MKEKVNALILSPYLICIWYAAVGVGIIVYGAIKTAGGSLTSILLVIIGLFMLWPAYQTYVDEKELRERREANKHRRRRKSKRI